MKDPSSPQGPFFQVTEKLLGCTLSMSEDIPSAPMTYSPRWLENCILPATNNAFQNCFAANAD